MTVPPPGPLPLLGVRVACLAVYVPAPAAARRLRALGAAVVNIEPPGGDPLAAMSPAWYAALHDGHEVVRHDLKRDEHRARFDDLLTGMDVLLTATRLPSLARLGLGWNDLHRRHPRLCHVAITGYPAPADDRPGHDLNFQAAAGLVTPPALPPTLCADLAGAESAAGAALALLLARERGHGAGRAEVALADAVQLFAEPLRYGLTAPGALLGGGLPGYACYQARDGWITVGALEPHFWATLLTELGLEPDATRSALEQRFLADAAGAWERWAAARGLPVVAVASAPVTETGARR